ncbi:hypothetical protein LDO32_08800 [Luteimonas sp. Y-2-2-4F]|nr:hypothetical protein [Luteimonas sp. Y-2-2-4F]MCD9031608.1 hypothetical protein [Luteimonas sp. Y-2-2-4F]MCD9031817.1 hypothetical protein [Luteimonas sp. Y-2-2-4F]
MSSLSTLRRGLGGVLVALLLALALPSQALAQCTATTTQTRAAAIANGHAFAKHGSEFVHGRVIAGLPFPDATIANAGQFATLVAGIINNPSQSKALANNRRAYWDNRTGTVVIYNPGANDCGTAFRPNAGVTYYNNLI